MTRPVDAFSDTQKWRATSDRRKSKLSLTADARAKDELKVLVDYSPAQTIQRMSTIWVRSRAPLRGWSKSGVQLSSWSSRDFVGSDRGLAKPASTF